MWLLSNIRELDSYSALTSILKIYVWPPIKCSVMPCNRSVNTGFSDLWVL